MSHHEDEPVSEFSYTQSDVLHQTSSKRTSKQPLASEYSTDSYSSSAAPFTIQPPSAPQTHDESRDSNISHFSQFSEQEHSVAQPVSVTVVDKNVNPVNRVLSVKRLETILGLRQDKVGPDVVYNTDIASSVPPRSARRPMSEYVAEKSPKQPQDLHRHQRGVSLAISDDLDKLMEKANSMTLQTFQFGKTLDLENPVDNIKSPKKRSSGRSSIYSSDDKGQSNINSQESFRTAHNSENMGSPASNSRYSLPPRPTTENLVRAREVSSQMERRLHRSDSFGIEEASNYSHDEKTTTYSRLHASETPLMLQIPSVDPLVDPVAEAEVALIESSGSLHGSHTSSSPRVDEAQPVTVSRANSAARRVLPYPRDEVTSSNYDEILELPPSIDQAALAKTQEIPPTGADDLYYDVDEPVLVEPPTRAKSVKATTKHPKKAKKTTKKRVKSGPAQLKPFSYHTLISLLESINGTIIGEEFEQLNLPIKEKQLIEKIIDSLSRLTSDMVLDEQRYEIGITRLETALRVLEGFM